MWDIPGKLLSLETVEGVTITAQGSGEASSGVQCPPMLREGGSSWEDCVKVHQHHQKILELTLQAEENLTHSVLQNKSWEELRLFSINSP